MYPHFIHSHTSFMKGIQYVNDSNGNPIKAVVDLSLYSKEFALFLQQLAAKYENTNSAYTSPSLFSNKTTPTGDVSTYVGGNTTNSNAPTAFMDKLLQTARTFIGTPYRTGGTTNSGMDCSGLTMTVYKSVGVNLPRVSRDQATVGQAVGKNELQRGDLLFFATGTPGVINHVGVVSDTTSGTVKFIHASTSRGVMEADLSQDYYQKTYMAARRVV